MTSRAEAQASDRRIRDFIVQGAADGRFVPGAKLPTERELARQFAVARSAVRRALARLEAEGAVLRHVGRGTFIPPRGDSASVAGGIADVEVSPAELVEARLRLEPVLAEFIVTRATAADFDRMAACLGHAEHAQTLDEWERWDAALHQAFAAATHNAFLQQVMDLVTRVRSQAEWGKLKDRIVTPERRLRYQEEHRRIVAALRDRDVAAARTAITEHLVHARRNLFGE
jgi:DNA-binding FadR family transcriptional regulator